MTDSSKGNGCGAAVPYNDKCRLLFIAFVKLSFLQIVIFMQQETQISQVTRKQHEFGTGSNFWH